MNSNYAMDGPLIITGDTHLHYIQAGPN